MSGPEDNGIDPEHDDATVVVPVDDATIAVVGNDATIAVRLDDHTIAVNSTSTPPVVPPVTTQPMVRTGSTHSTGTGATTASGHGTTSRRRNVGDPVEEADEIPPELAKLFFKNPLDPKRRAPESPFPKDQSALPRGGVRSSIPVVYGTRAEEQPAQREATEFSRWIGPPPPGYDVPLADRTALTSTARQNRRFRVLARLGSVGVTAVAVAGLWVVISLLVP